MLKVPTAGGRLPHRVWMLWAFRTVVSVLQSVFRGCASRGCHCGPYKHTTPAGLCSWKWPCLNKPLYWLAGKSLYRTREQPAAPWAVSWRWDLVPSTWCFQTHCYHRSQGLLARTEAPWSFRNFVHRLMPAVRLRAYGRSGMFGSGNETWFIESESWKLYGEKRKKGEEKTMLSKSLASFSDCQ